MITQNIMINPSTILPIPICNNLNENNQELLESMSDPIF